MIGSNYYMAISARFLNRDGTRRYFTGYLIDRETDKHRYDIVAKEKNTLETKSTLKQSTLSRNKIIGFSRKEHIRDFQTESVKVFNHGKTLNRYYNWKKMMLGLFVAEVEKRGVDIRTIDLKNVNYIIGEAY